MATLKHIPPENNGPGDWWITAQAAQHTCSQCKQEHEEQPAVLRYNRKLDLMREQDRKHPGWARKGWPVWWDCIYCDHEEFIVVTRQQVQAWGRALGGWRPLQ